MKLRDPQKKKGEKSGTWNEKISLLKILGGGVVLGDQSRVKTKAVGHSGTLSGHLMRSAAKHERTWFWESPAGEGN